MLHWFLFPLYMFFDITIFHACDIVVDKFQNMWCVPYMDDFLPLTCNYMLYWPAALPCREFSPVTGNTLSIIGSHI